MRVITSGSCEQAKTKATDFIAQELSRLAQAGKSILWLLSGGSSIAVATAAANSLDVAVTKQITIAQADERYVQPGSTEENWQQLIDSGLKPEVFKQSVSILSAGNSLASAVESYANILGELIKDADQVIGLFGIGSDGHTAGIKPAADAKAFRDFTGPALVYGYQAEDFERITITEAAIRQVDSGVVYACGEEKRNIIEQLSGDLPPHTQPAQLLKAIPTLVIFN